MTPQQRFKKKHPEKVAEASRAWSKRHPAKVLAGQRARRAKRKQWLKDYKTKRGCVDCGERDPIVLDFDHRDRKKKAFTISKEPGILFSSLKTEVAKCDIRCANCHRRKTYKEAQDAIRNCR